MRPVYGRVKFSCIFLLLFFHFSLLPSTVAQQLNRFTNLSVRDIHSRPVAKQAMSTNVQYYLSFVPKMSAGIENGVLTTHHQRKKNNHLFP